MAGSRGGTSPINPLQRLVFGLCQRGAHLLWWFSARLRWRGGLRCLERMAIHGAAARRGVSLTSGKLPRHMGFHGVEEYGPRGSLKCPTQGDAAVKADYSRHEGHLNEDSAAPLVRVESAEIEVVFDPAGRVRHANEAACGVTFGLGDCLTDQRIIDLFGPRLSDGAAIESLFAQVLRGQQQSGCFEMHPGEETARTVEGRFTALQAPDGTVQGLQFLGVEVAAKGLILKKS